MSGRNRFKMNIQNPQPILSIKTAGSSLILLCILLFLSPPSLAEIFKYRGLDGTIHFTDRPMAGKYRLMWKSGKSSSKSAYTGVRFKQNKSKLTPLIDQTAEQVRLHPGLLHAIVMVESAYNPQAKSHKGAQGLMQLMPATASRYGVDDSYDPRQNLEGGARYMKDLLAEFKSDLKLALAAYNAGENAVRKYGNQIPPFPETQKYVKKVMGYYKKNMQGMVN
ncbi:MAG: lytic transglycosylase domain-containing protein [Pseudomonadota bacterium]